MVRILIALFWISLLIGTLAAHSVVANWAVTVAGLYFAARWWAGRGKSARAVSVASPLTRQSATGVHSNQRDAAGGSSGVEQVRSRWTVDRTHPPELHWH